MVGVPVQPLDPPRRLNAVYLARKVDVNKDNVHPTYSTGHGDRLFAAHGNPDYRVAYFHQQVFKHF